MRNERMVLSDRLYSRSAPSDRSLAYPVKQPEVKMKKVLIAFDIDGTLRNNIHDEEIVANERIRDLLIILSSFKNVKILVWSGGGELYARQVANAIGIAHYVDSYATKAPDIRPDIAIDDMHEFDMSDINLIVREKWQIK